MLPLIGAEVTRRGWLSARDYEDVTVLAQSAPGILAINIAYYTGYRIRGVKGSIVAALGAALPSFLIILAIAMAFTGFKDNIYVRRFFQGVRPVAVALILSAALDMAKGTEWNWWTAALALGTVFLVAFLSVSPVWIILTVIAGAVSIALLKGKSSGPHADGESPHADENTDGETPHSDGDALHADENADGEARHADVNNKKEDAQ